MECRGYVRYPEASLLFLVPHPFYRATWPPPRTCRGLIVRSLIRFWVGSVSCLILSHQDREGPGTWVCSCCQEAGRCELGSVGLGAGWGWTPQEALRGGTVPSEDASQRRSSPSGRLRDVLSEAQTVCVFRHFPGHLLPRLLGFRYL